MGDQSDPCNSWKIGFRNIFLDIFVKPREPRGWVKLKDNSEECTQDRKGDHASLSLPEWGGQPVDHESKSGHSLNDGDDVVPATGKKFFFIHWISLYLICRNCNNNIPFLSAHFNIPVSLGDLFQSETSVNDRLKFSCLDQLFKKNQIFFLLICRFYF